MGKLPHFWQALVDMCGLDPDLVSMIHNDFQIVEIVLICAALLVGVVVTLAQSIRVWMCDNEDTKKQLKLARTKFFHTIVYIAFGLAFIAIFWEFILPNIWAWSVSHD